MRVSKYFKIGRDQATLDFVDVDYNKDTRLFLSPRALANLPSDWGDECVHLVQDFFKAVLGHIKAGHHKAAEELLLELREPNETHLGLSTGKSRGRALGEGSAHDVWRALTHSRAATSGLITDLEDTALLIEGVGVDIISDITTNIIRGPLIHYTQEMSKMYGIALTPNVPTGPIWDPKSKTWQDRYEDLPVTPTGKLLLVPKAIVRQHLAYSLDDYYRKCLIPHFRAIEIKADSPLVHILKGTKERKVYSKEIREKYGDKKSDVVEHTLSDPEIFQKYKDERGKTPFSALGHELIAAVGGVKEPDWKKLMSDLRSVSAGKEEASKYEDKVEAMMTALFYPALTNPTIQHEIHAGRKRIDITYTNMASEGFFRWVSIHYPAARIVIECKNYASDIANPELGSNDWPIFSKSRSRGNNCMPRVQKQKTLQGEM